VATLVICRAGLLLPISLPLSGSISSVTPIIRTWRPRSERALEEGIRARDLQRKGSERRSCLALGRGGSAENDYNVPRITKRLPESGKVTSDKQIRANRQNALKSTGPKSPGGKAAARRNALTHGLLSTEMLLPGEDEAALVELCGRLIEEPRPVGELEGLLVERIIGAVWRLRRLGRVEAGIFAWERFEELAERAEREADKYESHPDAFLMEVIDTEITDAEKHKEALSRAQQMRSEQEAETATLGRTFARDANGANAFSKLSRYETTIERGLYKALHELQRLQAARHGGSVPPPVAVDVDVSGVSGEGV
jgi:hypothetical protein